MVAFNALLTGKIMQKEPIPSGEMGYYFVSVYRTHWWDVMQPLAEILHAHRLVVEPKAEIWPSDDMVVEDLGFPRAYVRAMGTARCALHY